QKVLSSNSIFYPLKDYSFFGCSGEPKEGQTLEEVETLILQQIEKVRKGDFPDWLIPAVITDIKLKKTKELENNGSRADVMMSAFVDDVKWQDQVNTLNRLSKITKQDIIDFANKYISTSNYVVAYKRIGEDKSIVKVEKPSITPVEVDRENASMFVQSIQKSAPTPIEPKFIDYTKDVTKSTLKSNITLLYNKNVENNLFDLYYRFAMGSNNNKVFPIAVKCIPYLGSPNKSAAEVKQELYKLGCSFNVFSDYENIWVSLTGLKENFNKALPLFENVLNNPVLDETVLQNVIGDIIKERNDNKLQKRLILNRGMSFYARYGANNAFSNVLSDEELNKITVNQIKAIISAFKMYEHKILYYGPEENLNLVKTLNQFHQAPEKLKPVPQALTFTEKQLDKTVYVVDYDMKQAEIIMLTNGESYKRENVPVITLYNNYFGGGMSSVLFQDLRESKALAYSTYSRYNQPNKLTKKYYNLSYIGSQADKLAEAMKGLSDLLNEMPKAEASFNAAKESVLAE
ncbi:MAG: insulinase family protein, partial [Bacteroidota bacterium]